MARPKKGDLVPLGGGESIPLVRDSMKIGRRESCEISLQFPNISSIHAELFFRDGHWYVRDNGSKNGTKVNGVPVTEKIVMPGDEIAFAKHKFVLSYEASGRPVEGSQDNVFQKSLLERAGLIHSKDEETDDRWAEDRVDDE
jgi:adenylate cyclase